MSVTLEDDPFDLTRFMNAQEPVYAAVLRELRAGKKRTHWMWFIFPQLRGLGRSTTAVFFGLRSLAETRAYLDHPQLGTRLVDCVTTLLTHHGRSINTLLGSPDDMKFRSSMTLFAAALEASDGRAAETRENVFVEALRRFCDGRPDDQTLILLEAAR